MARPKGSTNKTPPKHCLHRASGRGYVTLGGSCVYTGAWDVTRRTPKPTAEADETYRRVIAEWATRKSLTAAADCTIAELISQFIAHREKSITTPSKWDKVRSLAKILVPVYGSLPTNSFGVKEFKVLRSMMIDQKCEAGKQIGAPWSRQYINTLMHYLKTTFKWGKNEGIIGGSAYEAVRDISSLGFSESLRDTEPVRSVSDSVVEATLPFLGKHMAAMVRLQRLMGCRGGELCVMRGCDIDMSSTTPLARARCGDCRPGKPCSKHASWTYKPSRHKNKWRGKSLALKIGPEAQRILSPHLKADPNEYVFTPADASQDTFESRRLRSLAGLKGEALAAKSAILDRAKAYSNKHARKQGAKRSKYQPHIRPGIYWMAINRAADAADRAAHLADPSVAADVRLVPRWHPHQLRHTHATLVNELYGPETVTEVLCHSDAKTRDRYIDPSSKIMEKVAAEIG